MSIRKLTDEQFAEGTTIDGNRLERALAEGTDRLNALEPSDLNRRWTQSQFVWGYQPSDHGESSAQFSAPWMTALSEAAKITGSTPEQGIQNPRRVKGTFLPYGSAATASKPLQWVWSNSWYFEKPVIIRTIHMSFHAPNIVTSGGGASSSLDNPFNNSFLWLGTPATPPGYSAADFVTDLIVALEVDNPFTQEVRSEASVEMHRSNFRVDNQLLRPYVGSGGVPPTPALNGTPPLPSDGNSRIVPNGLAVISDNINIPIPRRSRVRLHVVIPDWPVGAGVTRASPWGSTSGSPGDFPDPWQTQFYSGSMTILEPLEK